MKSRWALCARRYSTRCQLMHYVQVYLKKTIQTLASITKYRLLTKNCVFFSLPTLLCSSCRPLLMSNCILLLLTLSLSPTGPPVEVGVTMYVLSISSVSEVLMVPTISHFLYISLSISIF
uniref:Uncharacterized protein n=1 Tax=Cacopsylla melanoneura TaxID=428564 RepID=A0A8D8X6M9_9HEMI